MQISLFDELDPESKTLKFYNVNQNNPYAIFSDFARSIDGMSEQEYVDKGLNDWFMRTFAAQEFTLKGLDVLVSGKIKDNIFDEYGYPVRSSIYTDAQNVASTGGALD